MDINAGTIATGEETIEDPDRPEAVPPILDVASGRKKTFSDQWGLRQLAVFNHAGDLIAVCQ